MTRAIARRTVMKLSWKWRSGRERLRVVFQRPCGRGGETPRAFGNDERVAAENDRDMVVPAWKPSSLVVIDAELSFEVLIDPLRPPSLHHDSQELSLGHAPR